MLDLRRWRIVETTGGRISLNSTIISPESLLTRGRPANPAAGKTNSGKKDPKKKLGQVSDGTAEGFVMERMLRTKVRGQWWRPG